MLTQHKQTLERVGVIFPASACACEKSVWLARLLRPHNIHFDIRFDSTIIGERRSCRLSTRSSLTSSWVASINGKQPVQLLLNTTYFVSTPSFIYLYRSRSIPRSIRYQTRRIFAQNLVPAGYSRAGRYRALVYSKYIPRSCVYR